MQLLISVVSAAEVPDALWGGADIVDIKNPLEGSLGAPMPATIRAVRARVPGPRRISVAIGDMPNLPGTAALAALGAAACGADDVKVGLWGPDSEVAAVRLLAAVCTALEAYPNCRVIAGGYADAARAQTLDPRCLARVARAAGAAGCLIDTAVKDGRRLFDFLTPEAVQGLVAEAHECGLFFAVAGALHEQDLPLVCSLGADVVGIRSAACVDGRRAGPLDPARVQRLRAMLPFGTECTINRG
jgi:(5-formylfuran-3-yl)methyl phosphate synthase